MKRIVLAVFMALMVHSAVAENVSQRPHSQNYPPDNDFWPECSPKKNHLE